MRRADNEGGVCFSSSGFPVGKHGPREVSVIALDSDDAAVSRRTPLRNYLVAQVEDAGHTYVLRSHDGFALPQTILIFFAAKLRKLMTSLLYFRSHRFSTLSARKYNSRVSFSTDYAPWQENVYFSRTVSKQRSMRSPHSRPTIYMRQKDGIDCHIEPPFSQGSVSATLLKKEPSYKNSLAQLYDKWKGQKFDNTGLVPTFVYAISTDRPGRLADELFFFSLVNLAQHADVRLLVKLLRCTFGRS